MSMFDPPIRLTSRGIRWIYTGAIVIALVTFSTYVSLRLRVTYRLQYSVARVGDELRAYKNSSDLIHESLAVRLDNLERAIYADLLNLPKGEAVKSARPPSVDQWQINRDQELRKRIQQLEQWRLDEERRRRRDQP
jgi:hypothetical protein